MDSVFSAGATSLDAVSMTDIRHATKYQARDSVCTYACTLVARGEGWYSPGVT